MYSKQHTEVGAVVRSWAARVTSRVLFGAGAVLASGLIAVQFGAAQAHAATGEPARKLVSESPVTVVTAATAQTFAGVATNPDKKSAAELKAARAEKAEKKKAERAAKREEKLAKRASAKKSGSGANTGSKPASDDSMGGSDDPLEGL
jgi:hypothetical protein